MNDINQQLDEIDEEIVNLSHIEAKLKRFLRRKPVTEIQEEIAKRELSNIKKRVSRLEARRYALEGRKDPLRLMREKDQRHGAPAEPVKFIKIFEMKEAA